MGSDRSLVGHNNVLEVGPVSYIVLYLPLDVPQCSIWASMVCYLCQDITITAFEDNR